MEEIFFMNLSNGCIVPVKKGSVNYLCYNSIQSDFWSENKNVTFVNFIEISSIKTDVYYDSISTIDLVRYKNKLKNIYDLNISYDTFFMRLILSLIGLFEDNKIIVLNNVGLSNDILNIKKIFDKYLAGKQNTLIIIDSSP